MFKVGITYLQVCGNTETLLNGLDITFHRLQA